VFLWGFTATMYLQYINIYIFSSQWHYRYSVLAKSSTAALLSYAAAAASLRSSPVSSFVLVSGAIISSTLVFNRRNGRSFPGKCSYTINSVQATTRPTFPR